MSWGLYTRANYVETHFTMFSLRWIGKKKKNNMAHGGGIYLVLRSIWHNSLIDVMRDDVKLQNVWNGVSCENG